MGGVYSSSIFLNCSGVIHSSPVESFAGSGNFWTSAFVPLMRCMVEYTRGDVVSCCSIMVLPADVRSVLTFMLPLNFWCANGFQKSSFSASLSAILPSIKSSLEVDTRKSSFSPWLIFITWHIGPKPWVGYRLPFLLMFSLSLQVVLSFSNNRWKRSWMYAPSPWMISPKNPCRARFKFSSSMKSKLQFSSMMQCLRVLSLVSTRRQQSSIVRAAGTSTATCLFRSIA